MRALVTGASGMLGRHTVDVLTEAGVTVRAYVRRNSNVDHLPCPPGELVIGDAETVEVMERAVRGVDVIFHLAGYLSVGAPFEAGDEQALVLYRTVNVAFTEHLLAAALDEGVSRFLFASSSSVYDPAAAAPTPEEGPLGPISDYGRSKLAAEERVRAYQERGLATTIVRPPVIYGPGDRYFTPAALRLAQLPLLPLVNGGRSLFDVVYVRDVARLLWRASRAGAAVGRVYNAGPGEETSLASVLAAYHHLTGGGPRIVDVSPRAALRLRHVTRPLLRLVAPGMEATMTPKGIDLMSRDLHLDMGRAARELGFEPQYTVVEGLRETLR